MLDKGLILNRMEIVYQRNLKSVRAKKIPSSLVEEGQSCPVSTECNRSERSQRGEGSFEELRRELLSRKYSYKTVKAYIYFNRDFLHFSGKNSTNITEEDTKNYLYHLAEEKRFAASTLNQAINALKFYYGTMLKKEFVYEIKRPHKDRKLPVILSQEEVAKILSSVDNVKHKAILMLV